MDNVYVRPVRRRADGTLVRPTDLDFATAPHVHLRDPASGKPLDRDGEFKPNNEFWARRIAQGDVEETPSPAARAMLFRPAAPAVKPAAAPVPTLEKK